MSYFFLNSDVLLVEGACKGALYNLSSGEIISVTKTLKQVLINTEKGANIDVLSKDSLIKHALDLLSEKKLGYISNINTKPDKIKIHSRQPKLKMMWLALNLNCNLKCQHCYSASEPGILDGTLNLSYLFYAMKEAKEKFDLECIQLIGGEPLLLGKEKVTKILNEAYKLKIPTIEVFTNGHLIDDFYIDFFKEKKINLAVSIYSNIADDHDAVTNIAGSWLKTTNAIRKLVQAGIQIRFGIVAMTQNEKTVADTASWLKKEFGVSQKKKFDVVRSCGRGNNKDIIPWDLFKSRHMRLEPDFLPITISTLENTMFNNICWGEQICVMPNGDITPCEMEFDHVQGNITKQSLSEIVLGESGERSQRLTKDKIEVCKDCEYRYACWECRAMANQLDNQEFRKPLTCMYNPYTGEWEHPPANLETLFPKINNKVERTVS
ncbi:MAG: radical SAM protein [Candidatus Doudnabacteria bacterium]